MKPTSFSQNELFETCPKSWYYKYIKKVPYEQETHYMDAGTTIHSLLEKWYNGDFKDLDSCEEFFNTKWDSYNLDNTILKDRKNNYWQMCLNGINLQLHVTTSEMKIEIDEAVGYIDVVDEDNLEIRDWKSSTRADYNEKSYLKQLKYYTWLYYMKFNKLLNKAAVEYLKYKGKRGKLELEPTMEDVEWAYTWNTKIRAKMLYYIENPNKLPPFNQDFFFSPYKNLWASEGVLKWTLHIENSLIKLEGPMFKILENQLSKKFSYELKDAEYILKHKPDANTTVRYWNTQRRTLPMGMIHAITKTLKDYCEYKKVKFALDINDERQFNNEVIPMPDKFINDRELRDYQKKAVYSFLSKKIGILQLGTGAGKTEISLEIIRRLGYKTLFVVDKIELMKQTIQRIKDSLGIEVGQYGSNVKDIKHITVATIQTLNKELNYKSTLLSYITKLKKEAFDKMYGLDKDDKNYKIKLKKFSKEYNLNSNEIKLYNIKKQEVYKKYKECANYLKTIRFIIFDECHHVAASSFYRLGTKLVNTEFRLGLSATAFRTDGNDMAINATTGYKLFELNAKELIEKDYLIEPEILFLKNYITKDQIREIELKCSKGLINEKQRYQDQYKNFIVNNIYRNNLIIDIANKHKNKKVLILVKLVDHGKWLEENIEGSKYLFGETNKKEREQIFKDFKKGNINVLISTVSIMAEGLDFPSLDMIINATSNKSDIRTVQMLGRILRKHISKERAHYIDFIDNFGMLYSATKSRVKILKQEGHEVIIKKVLNQ